MAPDRRHHHSHHSEEELRKVAEDLRALGRSLARDFRDAADQARLSGHPASQAFKHGLRDVAQQARRSVRSSWSYPGYGWRARPPWYGSPPPLGGPGSTPGAPSGGGPYPYGPPGPPPWAGRPPHRPRRPSRPRHPPCSPLPPVRRRWDATTVVGLLAVLFGVAWLVDATHVVHVSVEAVVAMGLMLLGASLVITGRTDWSLSRRSWPVWLGAGMIVVLVATSSTFGVGNAIQDMSFGDKSVMAGAGDQTIHGGFGDLTVDASKLTNGGTVTIQSVAGRTYIEKLPKDATVDVRAHLFAGQICVDGRDVSSGVGASTNQTSAGKGSTITLDVHQAFGQILVGSSQCASGRHG